MRKYLNPQKALEISTLLLAFSLPFTRSGLSLFVILVTLLWPFAAGKDELRRRLSQPVIISIFAFFGFLCLSLLWTKFIADGLEVLKNASHLLMIPGIVLAVRKTGIPAVLRAFAAGMLVHFIMGYLGMLIVLPYTNHLILKEPVYFMNRLDYVFLLSVTATFGINRLLYLKRLDLESTLTISVGLISLGTILQLFSRIGYIMTGAGLLIIFILRFQGKYRLLATGLALVLALLSYQGMYKYNRDFRHMVKKSVQSLEMIKDKSLKRYTTSWGQRLFALETGWRMFQAKPFFGYGIGDNKRKMRWILKKKMRQSRLYLYTYNNAEAIRKHHFHNQYIEIITQVGATGFILMILMFVFIWRSRPPDPMWSSFASAFLVIIITGFFAEPYLYKQFASAMISFCSALLLARKEADENSLDRTP